MKGSKALFIIGLLLNIQKHLCGVSPDQMMSAAKLTRSVCEPKFPKIPTAVLDNISEGEFPNDKDVKCYVNCVMEMMQTMKKGKFNLEATLKQINILLPEDYRDEYRNGFNTCKGSAEGIKDNCEASYSLLKCLHSNIPRFLFP